MSTGNRFLIAVDGSAQSVEVVRYARSILPRKGTEVVLLHVLSSVPEVLRDIEADPGFLPATRAAKEWEALQRKKVHQFMDMARKLFLEAGFAEKTVIPEIRERKEGLARDISAEACSGLYSAVILGRTGTNPLHNSILGSVASKVTEVCQLPVWLVGGKPAPNRVLIGMDASAGSMAAVAHVGRMHNGSDMEIRLLHVVRRDGELQEGFEHGILERYFSEIRNKAEEEIKPLFNEAKEILGEIGIPPHKISTKVITGVSSRSGAILGEAVRDNFGTIALGRRGLSKVVTFDMGRVSNKVIHMASNQAVWVVGP